MTTELLELDVYNRNLRYVDEDARRGAEVDETLRQRKEARESTRWMPNLHMAFHALFPRRTVPNR